MEHQNTAREKILKKVRNALLSPTENPYNHVDFEADLYDYKEDLDVLFAQQFNLNGGQFIYCENPKDFTVQLDELRKAKGWEKIQIVDEDLVSLFDKCSFKHFKITTDDERSLANLSLCEGLIARTGSIIVSSEQKESKLFHYQTDHLLFVASIKHITSNLQLAMKQLEEKYHRLPADLSVISGVDQLEYHYNSKGPGIFGPKEIYLFLIDK